MTDREANNNLPNATSITSGTPSTGQLSSASDVDYYRTSSGPGTISIDIDHPVFSGPETTYSAVQDLWDQYGVFQNGNYGLTVNVISSGALVGGNGNRPDELIG